MQAFKMEKPQQLALPGFERHFLQKESNRMSVSQMVVPFHGSELFIIEHNGEPYTPMKHIVENMGLAWQAQLAKLNGNRERWGITKIVIPTLGDMQETVCLPLRKLLGWLMTISPNKIPNPDTRAKVIMYQNECDDVLWGYWTKGQAVNPRPRVKRTTKDKRTALHEAIALLMTKSKHLHFKDCYKIIHQRFNVNHLDEIPEHMLPEAVNFVHQLLTGGGAEQNSTLRHDMKLLALGTLSLIDDFGDLIKAAVLIDEKAGEFFLQSATKASRLAIDTSHKHDLRTIRGEPIVSRMLTVTNDLGVRWSVNGMLRKDP